jgi:hypothetical protein
MVRRPPEPELVVFLDENLDGESVAKALRDASVPTRRLSEELDRSMEDAVWLPMVAAHGWAIATRDNRIRHRPAERAAIREAAAIVIVLRGDGLRGDAIARTLISAYPAVKRLVARYQAPMIIHLYADGRIKMTENSGRRSPKRST